MDTSPPPASQRAPEVATTLAGRVGEVSADVYQLIVREIPQLRADSRVLALLDASVAENVSTALHILQHDIDVAQVNAPAAAQEYARRLAQRGVPMTALLRAYRIGATRFQQWCLEELARRVDDAPAVSATGLRIAEVTAAYIDRVSEEVAAVYAAEQGTWVRNLSVARTSRVRALLNGDRVDVDGSEAILGYRLRQHHVGVVCWLDDAESGGAALTRLDRAVAGVAHRAGCEARPVFVPQDDACAWAWLPLGARDTFTPPPPDDTDPPADRGIRFAFGAVGAGLPGFRRTHRQALGAHAVALAAGPAGRPTTSFDDVAPLALMTGSIELLRDWVVDTLGPLAGDDQQSARLRDTLRVFLRENGSYKATAERLSLHKNSVQYRIRKAEEALAHPVDRHRLSVEVALLAAHWLGGAVLGRGASRPPTP